jgi:hypothetical protein
MKSNRVSFFTSYTLNLMISKISSQREEVQTLGFGIEGREKTREATGAARTVRRREPAKRPGRVSSPREIAPSSRIGSTTK